MPTEYTLPFDVLNNIPAVSGIDEVTIEIPEPIDVALEVVEQLTIADEVVEAVLDALDDDENFGPAAVAEGIEDALFTVIKGNRAPTSLMDDIAEEIASEVDIQGVTSDDIIDSVLEALEVDDGDIVLNLEGSLFATEDEFVDLFAEAIEQADGGGGGGGGGGLLPDIDPLEGLINDVLDAIDDIDVPDIDDIQDAVQEAVVEAVEEAIDLGPLGDPEEFVDTIVDFLVERLVSQEASEELQDALDNL